MELGLSAGGPGAEAPPRRSPLPHPGNADSAAPDWLPAALLGVRRLFTCDEPALNVRLARVDARLSRMNGAGSFAAGLLSPSATPFIRLMEALRADYGLEPDGPRMAAVGAGALALYVYVRIQDDIVDEPDLFDRADVYTAEVFAGGSARAFAEAVQDNVAFSSFRQRVLTRFAAAAVWEVDAYRGGAAPDDFEQLGSKFLPMAVPLGALAVIAGRAGDLAAIERLVIEAGTGLQLVNDILNVQEDHERRRLTPVLRWLYAEQRITAADATCQVRLALLAGSALVAALERARAAIACAERIAAGMAAPRLARMIGERAAFLPSVPHRLLGLHLGHADL